MRIRSRIYDLAGIVTRIHTYVYALNIAPIYMRENFACIAKYV
jgi:hypothetical protein